MVTQNGTVMQYNGDGVLIQAGSTVYTQDLVACTACASDGIVAGGGSLRAWFLIAAAATHTHPRYTPAVPVWITNIVNRSTDIVNLCSTALQ
jgi:hypothetical protein